MVHRVRVPSGWVLLLVMLGLPVVPVMCALACPDVTAQATAPPRERIASTSTGAPCHDAAEPVGDAQAFVSDIALSAWTPHAACEHPPVLSSPRAPEGLRVPTPDLVACHSSAHLSPAASHAVVLTLAAARAPSPPPGDAFSPVLRI